MINDGHSLKAIGLATVTATVIYASVLTPFDVIKNSQIVSRSPISARQAIMNIMSSGGPRNLWRGLPASLASVSIRNIVYYPLYEVIRSPLQEVFGILGPGLGGGICRVFSVLASSPVEKFKTAIQAKGYDQFSEGSFKGLRATIYRDILFSSVLFFFSENLSEVFRDKGKWTNRILSVGIGGTVAVLITHPLDVLKTKLQAVPCCYGDLETNVIGGLKDIARTEGVHELRRGMITRFFKLVPGFFLYLSMYEFIKDLVDK